MHAFQINCLLSHHKKDSRKPAFPFPYLRYNPVAISKSKCSQIKGFLEEWLANLLCSELQLHEDIISVEDYISSPPWSCNRTSSNCSWDSPIKSRVVEEVVGCHPMYTYQGISSIYCRGIYFKETCIGFTQLINQLTFYKICMFINQWFIWNRSKLRMHRI